MNHSIDNIFSALGKYNSANSENYLTESFVYILNYLLHNDKDLLTKFLNSLLVNDEEFEFRVDENYNISSQNYFQCLGIPDIKIETENKLILIEVKFDSGLGNMQIERYNAILYNSTKSIKKLILLSRHVVDIPKENIQPYKKIRWFQVVSILKNLYSKNDICNYFIKSFIKYLKYKKMSVKKVSWEFLNGLNSLNNFASMLEIALTSGNFTNLSRSAGANFYGFYFYSEKQRYWCGIRYEDPIDFVFQIIGETNNDLKEYKKNLEDVYFFSLDSDKQLATLINIVNDFITKHNVLKQNDKKI